MWLVQSIHITSYKQFISLLVFNLCAMLLVLGIHSLWLYLNLFCLLWGLTHEARLISWIHLELLQIWNMALSQISCSERETHAMDSNLTHSPRASFFSRSELLTSVLLFCGYTSSQMLDYSHRFAWWRASCQMQNGLLLVCLGPPVAVFCSITCVYVNEVVPHSWESTDRERKRWQRNTNSLIRIVYSEIRIVKSLKALQLHWLHFIEVKMVARQKKS